jgi:hypothetical protein
MQSSDLYLTEKGGQGKRQNRAQNSTGRLAIRQRGAEIAKIRCLLVFKQCFTTNASSFHSQSDKLLWI